MESDQDFATKLQELIKQLQPQPPAIQVVLEELRVRSKVEVGNIQQFNGKVMLGIDFSINWHIYGDVKVVDVVQGN